MPKTLAPRTPANPHTLLGRILDQPDLVSAVQALPPAALLRLIDRVGLEDAGELVALTTVDQLRRVFDEDIWRSGRPGEDERFDPERFTLWLEVMLEAGERFAADKLAELPEDLVELALHHHVLVISLEELALLISEGEGQVPLEKVVEDSPYLEFGEYCVIGRRWDDWETIATVLTALDERHSNSLQPMLERLWRVTNDYVYGQGGLFQVLTSEEMLASDAAADREDRRERSGFVAPASARSFLALARTADVDSLLQTPARDPITSAFFRHSEPQQLEVVADAATSRGHEAGGLRALLAEVVAEAPTPQLIGSAADAPVTDRLINRALVDLAGRDPARHADRIRELGYLTNLLLAGAGARGARLRPFDAAQATLATCSLGLERALADASESRAGRRLEQLTCDVLFRVGWRLLHDEVARPAAAAIERVSLRAASTSADPRDRIAFERLATAARAALDEHRPAALGARLDLLADALDNDQLAQLASLSDDLPTLLAADGKTLDRIASTEQLRRARRFLEAL
jgi:hypothetical protein